MKDTVSDLKHLTSTVHLRDLRTQSIAFYDVRRKRDVTATLPSGPLPVNHTGLYSTVQSVNKGIRIPLFDCLVVWRFGD